MSWKKLAEMELVRVAWNDLEWVGMSWNGLE